MRKFIFIVLSTFLFSIAAAAQNPEPTATPPTDEGNILKISTTLIQVDVTVTDKKGNIIRDLKPEDFEIYENGQRQEITNFSFISVEPQSKASENSNAPNTAAENKKSIPIPPVKLKPEQVRRTYALVVDDLGLSFESIFLVKQSLKKFVNQQMQSGDLVAIIRTGSGIGALQSFTADKRLLMAAIDKIKWNSYGRSGVSAFDPINTSLKEDLQGTKKTGGGAAKSVSGLDEDKKFARQVNEIRSDNFSVGTLGSLSYVIRGMRELPGRKAVMLFSEGFVLTSESAPNRILETMRVLADLANRSSVVFYTLDPRGLQVPGMANANDVIREVMPDDFDPAKYSDDRFVRESDFRDTQQSLRYLAYETGGVPFVNQNNISLGLQRAIDDQGNYYLLGYQPAQETFDPQKNKFNKLEVKVNRPDIKIRYRSGFFSVTDEKYRVLPQTPRQILTDALISPFGASEIELDLYSIFYNDERNRDFIRSLVYINPEDLTFTPDGNGIYHAKFDVIAAIFDSSGAFADNRINSQELKFTKEQLAKVRQKGIIYDLPVPVVKTGAYQFRIALRDQVSGKTGAVSQFIEVPNLKKNKLTLSNLILTNYPLEEWKQISLGQAQGTNDKNTLLDTTLRRFRRGTVLRYSYVIYNAKLNKSSKPNLQIQTRLIRDEKVLLESEPKLFDASSQPDQERLQASGAITLGKNLVPGSYILQVVVGDNQRRDEAAAQFIEFEIVN